MITIKTRANCDNAVVAWTTDKPIDKCLGFALAAQSKTNGHIYASILELNDPEVVPAIAVFGKRAHVILSDGAHAAPASAVKAAKASGKPLAGPWDENADARAKLAAAQERQERRQVVS